MILKERSPLLWACRSCAHLSITEPHFDIAGKGIAQYVSMEQAIRIAAEYARIYKKNYPAFRGEKGEI